MSDDNNNTAVMERPPAVQGLELVDAPVTIKHALERYQLLEDCVNFLMRKGEHYGPSYDGDDKDCLHKSGADVLCVAFQLVAEYVVDERQYDNNHREYRVDCTIKSQETGIVLAHGVGTCATLEPKYRYRKGKRVCPACKKDTIFKSKYEDKNWYCWAKKGGCGATFESKDPVIVDQNTERVEHPDVADTWNTVLKMGKKRAYVDSVIAATGATPKFSQDAEDRRDAPRNGAGDQVGNKAKKNGSGGPQPASEPNPKQKEKARLAIQSAPNLVALRNVDETLIPQLHPQDRDELENDYRDRYTVLLDEHNARRETADR